MKNRLITLCLVLYLPIFAQKDTTNIGHFSGKIRTFGMATQNKGLLDNHAAWAIGGGLRYESPILLKHVKFCFDGSFIYNLASTNLSKLDSITKARDRYEVGLFDIENLDNRNRLDRLDALNVVFYFSKKNTITLGRQVISSPLINPQDGRMRPSMMSGVWGKGYIKAHTTLQGGYLWASAPRSTVRWFSIAESIGIYSSGVNEWGKSSNYRNNLASKGLLVVGLESKWRKKWHLQMWNYTIENIQNTFFTQLNFENTPPSVSQQKWVASLQIIKQNALNNGGNADPLKTYIQKGEKAWVFGARLGLKSAKNTYLLNYTRITADGRFTFPREWGRDPLFTFMQRERNEGAGNVHAANITWLHNLAKNETFVGFGIYKMPDVLDFKMNKYGLPSYAQLNISYKYRFKGNFERLTLEGLIVHKWNMGNLHNNERYRINKVDMTNFNIIANYTW